MRLSLLILLAACAPPVDAPAERLAAPDGPGVAGVLLGADEQPIAGEPVLACTRAACLTTESAADGSFFFPDLAPGATALKTHPAPSGAPRAAAALEPVVVEEGALVDAEWVYVPSLPSAGGPMLVPPTDEAQALPCGHGLELTLRTADLAPALGDTLADLACAELPAAHLPSYPGLDDADVLAVYALHPFAATSASPVAVSAPSDLPPGTPVRFFAVDELDGTLSTPVPGVADGQRVATDPGAGVARLTHLVVAL